MAGNDGEGPQYVTQEQLQKLVQDFNAQLTTNMNTVQASMVAEVVKAMKAQGTIGAHEEELDETDEEYAARLQQEEEGRKNAQGLGRGGGRGGAVLGRGRGRGRAGGVVHKTDNEDTFMLHRNDHFQRRPRNGHDQPNEEKFGKLKFSMPKFEGTSDPDAYLTWELKVDKIFRMHNYSEEKKVHMAALDFDGYALIWWEQIQNQIEENDEFPVSTWAEMKREMRARFVPKHYKRDLFDKLQNLKQGSKSVEEYYKEMEQAMIRARVHEDEEQSMARFLSGLNKPIKRVVEFQTYHNVVELVHIAQKAERHLNDDVKSTKQSSFSSRATTSAPKTARFDLGHGMFSSSSSSNTNARSTTAENSQASPNVEKSARPTSSKNNASAGSTSRSSGIQCFKCLGRGHVIKDCPNNRVMIVTKDGEYESASEDECEFLAENGKAENKQECEDDDYKTCPFEAGHTIVVTKALSVQLKEEEKAQRFNLFHTQAKVNGKLVRVIVDGGSCHNLASKEMCEKLGLNMVKHPHPYHVQWLSDCGDVKVQYMVKVTFSIHDYTDTVECDVVPMTVCHLLLGRPWQFDRHAMHDGHDNTYAFKWQGKGVKLLPMTPNQIIAANMQKKARESEVEKKNSSAVHKSVSERHKPNLSGKTRELEGKGRVMIATKSEMREMKDNPHMMHFVMLYKDAIFSTNDITALPSVVFDVLQAFKDVFPEEVPASLPPLRGIEHQIDLIPGSSLPNRPPYRTNPEETKEIQRQVQELLDKGSGSRDG